MDNIKQVIEYHTRSNAVTTELKKVEETLKVMGNGYTHEISVQISSPYGGNVNINRNTVTEEDMKDIVAYLQAKLSAQSTALNGVLASVDLAVDPVLHPVVPEPVPEPTPESEPVPKKEI